MLRKSVHRQGRRSQGHMSTLPPGWKMAQYGEGVSDVPIVASQCRYCLQTKRHHLGALLDSLIPRLWFGDDLLRPWGLLLGRFHFVQSSPVCGKTSRFSLFTGSTT